MKKRIFSALALVMAMVTVVCTGCNSGDETESSKNDTTTTSSNQVVDITSVTENEVEFEETTENKDATTKANEHLTVATTAKAPSVTKNETKKPSGGSLTAEEIVDIYFRNQQTWLPEDAQYGYAIGCNYKFLDLDFDGIPELLVNVNQGSGLFSSNTYFRINKSTKKVESIKCDADEYGYQFDYGTIKLVKNVNTGKMRYYCSDTVRVSNQEYGVAYGVTYCENNKINTEILFEETFTAAGTYNNTEDIEKFYYNVGGESVETTKGDYEKRVDAFFAENKDLNVKYETIDGYEFREASPSQQKAMLLKSYNAFSYDK